MTKPSSDRQVGEPLNVPGWTGDNPVSGDEPGHMLEGTIATGQFILAPMKVATISSVDVKTETGAEFLQWLIWAGASLMILYYAALSNLMKLPTQCECFLQSIKGYLI